MAGCRKERKKERKKMGERKKASRNTTTVEMASAAFPRH